MAATLEKIKKKTRLLSNRTDTNQLSDDDLLDYINDFVLYDMSEHLRLFNLHEVLTFYTQPYVDTYDTNTTVATDPLYDFKNTYISVQPPVYIGGYNAQYFQDRTSFFNIWPLVNTITQIASGDGSTLTFTGFIPVYNNSTTPATNASLVGGMTLLKSNITITSVDSDGTGLILVDYPSATSNIIGYFGVPDQGADSITNQGQINYTTGQYTITFPSTAPASAAAINSQVVLIQTAIPTSILFFDGVFTVRPVPNQVYRITIEAFKRPDQLLSDDQEPKLGEWWQYIAYGAAKKILEDQNDAETVSIILPEFENQRDLIQRRTLKQLNTQKAATIYDGSIDNNNGNIGYSYNSGWGAW